RRGEGRDRVLGGRGGRLVAGGELGEQLGPVHLHRARRVDAHPDDVAADLEDRHGDVVAQDDALPRTTAQHQHGETLRHGSRRRGETQATSGVATERPASSRITWLAWRVTVLTRIGASRLAVVSASVDPAVSTTRTSTSAASVIPSWSTSSS